MLVLLLRAVMEVRYSTTINLQKSLFVNPSANKGFGGVGPTSAPTPNGFDTSGNFWFAGGGGGTSDDPDQIQEEVVVVDLGSNGLHTLVVVHGVGAYPDCPPWIWW